MARWEIKNVNIAGVAMAVPEHTVKTVDIDLFTPEEADVMGYAQGVIKAFAEICMARRLGGTLSEVLVPLGCRFLDRRNSRGNKPAVLPIPIGRR